MKNWPVSAWVVGGALLACCFLLLFAQGRAAERTDSNEARTTLSKSQWIAELVAEHPDGVFTFYVSGGAIRSSTGREFSVNERRNTVEWQHLGRDRLQTTYLDADHIEKVILTTPAPTGGAGAEPEEQWHHSAGPPDG